MENGSSGGGGRLKSAYETALERMGQGGIERPRPNLASLSSATDVRRIEDRREREIAEFDSLQEVELREVWHHEALSFTPWLSENLDKLSDAIGMPLELVDREVKVESFSADIVARSTEDDSITVLIENQLEKTDHRHLGQIVTYLAGTEAQVTIWIASEFQGAHLSAIDWLNEHTAPSFSFFAIRVKVVQIGDSPSMAPIFEVLAKPSKWNRTVQARARRDDDLNRFRTNFWSHFCDRHREEHYGCGRSSNMLLSSDHPDLAVSLYLGKSNVGVYIRGHSVTDHAYKHLEPFEECLRIKTGKELQPTENYHYCPSQLDIDMAKSGNWDEASDWLHEKAVAYLDALSAISREEES